MGAAWLLKQFWKDEEMERTIFYMLGRWMDEDMVGIFLWSL